jgi:hypothetical protein
MTQNAHEALIRITQMDIEETQRYLMAMLDREPELFESIQDDVDHQYFLEELRSEYHYGHRMYPEL